MIRCLGRAPVSTGYQAALAAARRFRLAAIRDSCAMSRTRLTRLPITESACPRAYLAIPAEAG